MSAFLALQLALQLVEALLPLVSQLVAHHHEALDLSALSAEHAAALEAMHEAFRTKIPDGR